MEDALLEQSLADVPLVVLDTETTGLYPGLGDRVVEVGAVRFEAWRETGRLSQFVNPGRHMSPDASRVSGIRDQDLAGQPAFAALAPRLLELLDGALLVAHNAAFDAGFIGQELYIAGFTAPDQRTPPLPNPWLCTLQLARRHFHFGRNSLAHVARVLQVRPARSHRALNDVYTTADVLKRMAQELARFRLTRVGDLLHAQGGAIYAPPPPRVELPELVAAALAQGQKLEILYLGQAGETRRLITPRYVTRHEGAPYLVALCHLRQDQRAFRLDRIFSAALAAD